MLKFTVNDVEYSLKQNLKEITIKEYFDIMKIQSEKLEMPVKDEDKFMDGTYEVKYYERGSEPIEFRWRKDNELISLLAGIPLDVLEQSPELSETLMDYIEPFEDDSAVWSNKRVMKTITVKKEVEKNGKVKMVNVEEEVESDYIWKYDKVNAWSFQQWVDCENASRQTLYYPFLIALFKQKEGSKTKVAYNRSHPDFDDKEAYWLNQTAYGNINTIVHILNEMSKVREMFYWIYEAQTAFPEKQKKTEKIYSTFAGWNDVVVSLSETNAFNSSKGTLYAVRNANCIEVLEYLNWKRGKAFAEYEDYKLEEQAKKFQNVIG